MLIITNALCVFSPSSPEGKRFVMLCKICNNIKRNNCIEESSTFHVLLDFMVLSSASLVKALEKINSH